MRAQMQRAVEAGKQTAEAAAYFESLWTAHPDMGQCLNAARDIVGTNDPQQLTRYQQSLFTDRLSEVTSRVASQRMMKMQNEESAVRRHAQDGSPTGENYWTEAGASLIAPDVPTFVKDEVLRDMQRDRPADSPAFEEPGEGEFKPVDGGDVEGYAEHVRRMKKSLLSGSDWK